MKRSKIANPGGRIARPTHRGGSRHGGECRGATLGLAAAFAALVPLAPEGRGDDRPGLGLVVPPGCAIERAAAPELVRRPLSAAFDELGRLYVVESPAAGGPGTSPDDEGGWRIARLSDDDGDGVFDRRSAFADLGGIPGGVAWLGGSLYIAESPGVWKLTDADDDGVADHREACARVATDAGAAGRPHGPFLGPDGRMYLAHRSPGGPAEGTARILRMKPDGSDLERAPAAAGADPIFVALTRDGEQIVASAGAPSREGGVVYAVDAGRWEGGDAGPAARRPSAGGPGDLLVLLRTPATPAAMTLSGRPAPDGEGESAYLCYPGLHRVGRILLAGGGSTYPAREEVFVAGPGGRSGFHPAGAIEDADGSLIVLDPGRGAGCCGEDGPGGVYRVRRLEGGAVPDPRGLRIDWRHSRPKELVPCSATIGRPSATGPPRRSPGWGGRRPRPWSTWACDAARPRGGLRPSGPRPASTPRRPARWPAPACATTTRPCAGRPPTSPA